MRPGSLPEFDTKTGTPRWVGAGVVVGLHVLVGWALMSGLARKALDVVRLPVEMAIIDEVKPPPPPPPPPPPAEPPKVVKLQDAPPPAPTPPPKAYVPPPEVTPAPTPPAPAIQAVQAEPPPKQVEIKPPPPPAPPAPPAPPMPPAPPAASVRAEVGLACPGYADIIQATMAGAYDRFGVTGVVRVRMLVRGSQIVDVTPLSGPKEYHRLVTQAARRFKCQASGSDEVQVTFEVSVRED